MTVLPQLERELRSAHRRVSRRSRIGWLAPGVAVAATVAVAAVFVIGLRHSRSPAGGGDGGGGTVVLQSTPIDPRAPLDAGVGSAVGILEHRFASALPTVHVSRLGNAIALSGVTPADRARALDLATAGRLAFFDWEASVLLANGRTAAAGLTSQDPDALRVSQGSPGVEGGVSLYEAVKLAQRLPRSGASHSAPELYLFGPPRSSVCAAAIARGAAPSASGPCYLAGPAPTRNALVRGVPIGSVASGQVMAVPPGMVVLQAANSNPAGHLALSDPAARFFVLQEREAFSGSEITHPAASSDPTGQPDVTFEFTPAGTAAFLRATRALAHRGAAISSAGQILNQHFAIALDGRLLSVPEVDFRSYPDGIRTSSADVTGGFTTTSARDLAAILRFGALPVTLTPQ